MLLEYGLGHREKGAPPLSFARVNQGWEWLGWFMPIALSFLFTTVTWHKALLPFRHLEYIAYPLAILSGLGAYVYWRTLAGSSSTARKLDARHFAYFVIAVLVLNLASHCFKNIHKPDITLSRRP